MKRVIAVATVIGLVSSSVAVADPLAAGKPAGIKQAQIETWPPMVWVALGGLVAVGIWTAVALPNNSSLTSTTAAPSTTG
jgi:hypothetical protein